MDTNGAVEEQQIPIANLIEPDISACCELLRDLYLNGVINGPSEESIGQGSDILKKIYQKIDDEYFVHLGCQPTSSDPKADRTLSYEECIRKHSLEFYNTFPEYFINIEEIPSIDTHLKLIKTNALLSMFESSEKRRLGKRKHSEKVYHLEMSLPYKLEPLRNRFDIEESVTKSLFYTSGIYPVTLVKIHKYDDTPSVATDPKLLWHGSQLQNISVILKEGLSRNQSQSLAHPSFGPGIYFYESASNAIQDCHPNKGVCERLLLLCEVDMRKCLRKCLRVREVQELLSKTPQYESVHHRRRPLDMSPFQPFKDAYGAEFYSGELRRDVSTNVIAGLNYREECLSQNEKGSANLGRFGFSQQIVYHPDRVKVRYVVHVRLNG